MHSVVIGVLMIFAINAATPDMSLTKEQKEYFFGKSRASAAKRAMTSYKEWLWPNGIIPWQFDSTLDNVTVKDIITKAVEHVQSKTCVRFIKRTNEKVYVNFKYGNFCTATLGYLPNNINNVTYSKAGLYCTNGSMVHELGHVVGLLHEHNRPDRDDYVKVNWTNIQYLKEFIISWQKWGNDTIDYRNIPYDYASIMHYSRYFMAKDPNYPTLIPTRNNSDGSLVETGYTEYLSPLDIKQINLLYGCTCTASGQPMDEESNSEKEPENE